MQWSRYLLLAPAAIVAPWETLAASCFMALIGSAIAASRHAYRLRLPFMVALGMVVALFTYLESRTAWKAWQVLLFGVLLGVAWCRPHTARRRHCDASIRYADVIECTVQRRETIIDRRR